MTTVAEQEEKVETRPPNAEGLTERQLLGIDCACCGAYLGVQARRLGEIEDRGYLLQLFACHAHCAPAPLPRRERYATWPPGGRPSAAP